LLQLESLCGELCLLFLPCLAFVSHKLVGGGLPSLLCFYDTLFSKRFFLFQQLGRFFRYL
jgi:hypothetical protein